ncbi:hypothetical protein FB451DRAFT_1413452 [Mycena latifolia]|nr:hypothetical protein FB451DRAFT_1413452 [Mycena latifolia]
MSAIRIIYGLALDLFGHPRPVFQVFAPAGPGDIPQSTTMLASGAASLKWILAAVSAPNAFRGLCKDFSPFEISYRRGRRHHHPTRSRSTPRHWICQRMDVVRDLRPVRQVFVLRPSEVLHSTMIFTSSVQYTAQLKEAVGSEGRSLDTASGYRISGSSSSSAVSYLDQMNPSAFGTASTLRGPTKAILTLVYGCQASSFNLVAQTYALRALYARLWHPALLFPLPSSTS